MLASVHFSSWIIVKDSNRDPDGKGVETQNDILKRTPKAQKNKNVEHKLLPVTESG